MLGKRMRILGEQGYEDIIPVFTFDAGFTNTGDDDAAVNRYEFDGHYKENRRDDGTDPARTALDRARTRWRDQWIGEIGERGMVLARHVNTEADDIMAYMANALADDADVALWTTDKDLMQCVDDERGVFMIRYRRGSGDVNVRAADVMADKGVPPTKIRLQLALQGDAADNYARIPGYGGKRGLAMLTDASSMDDLVAALPKYEDQLRFNWTLAGVGADYMPTAARAQVDSCVADCVWRQPESHA
jgi:5'-3' exonuclease